MEKKEAFEVVLAMIAANKIHVPEWDGEDTKQWAADVREIVERCVYELMKAPEPKL